MANMALTNVYNHYLTAYSPIQKGTGKYDAHKKSELRGVYNSIVKLNKESPLSIIDTREETTKFAIDMKENARVLHNTIASLGGLDEEELLSRKAAYSDDENVVSAKYIGDGAEGEEAAEFEINVERLAEPQVNTGHYLTSNASAMRPGSYSFDVLINNTNYEFQFNVNEGETNKQLQNKLARLINNSNIGIEASVKESGSSMSALVFESTATGSADGQSLTFEVSDENTSKKKGAVDYLGLDYVSKEPQNAKFYLNGTPHEAYSNKFTVAKTYEITLNSIQTEGDDPIRIGTKADTESLTENVNKLVGGYNDFIKAASAYLGSQPKSGNLVGEMNRISDSYFGELQALGLDVQDDGTIKVNTRQLKNVASLEDARESFASVRKFTNSVLNKTNQITLNPMNYVQKTIVAYKNPGKEYATPYITSQYSGMMFNSYC